MKKIEPKYKIGQTVLYTCIGESEQSKFTIKDIELDSWEDDQGKEHPYYVYYDDIKSAKSVCTLDEEDIEGVSRESIEINDDTLKNDGWEYYSEFDGDITGYKRDIEFNNKLFYCDIKPLSNTPGRDWYVLIENDKFESVGSMDVGTFGQLDRFLQLLSE